MQPKYLISNIIGTFVFNEQFTIFDKRLFRNIEEYKNKGISKQSFESLLNEFNKKSENIFRNKYKNLKTPNEKELSRMLPVFNSKDDTMFCLCLENNSMSPHFAKGDYLIISPETWVRSGDVAAIEYGNDMPVKAIMQVTYMDEFIVLESVNHKQAPVALIRGKDHFRVIGKVIHRYQKLG